MVLHWQKFLAVHRRDPAGCRVPITRGWRMVLCSAMPGQKIARREILRFPDGIGLAGRSRFVPEFRRRHSWRGFGWRPNSFRMDSAKKPSRGSHCASRTELERTTFDSKMLSLRREAHRVEVRLQGLCFSIFVGYSCSFFLILWLLNRESIETKIDELEGMSDLGQDGSLSLFWRFKFKESLSVTGKRTKQN